MFAGLFLQLRIYSEHLMHEGDLVLNAWCHATDVLVWSWGPPRFRGHLLTELERCSDATNKAPVPGGILETDHKAV